MSARSQLLDAWAEAELAAGRGAEALVWAERSLAQLARATDDPVRLAPVRLLLGRALWKAGQQDEAREAVRQARAALAPRGEELTVLLGEIDDWLTEIGEPISRGTPASAGRSFSQ